jgi:hypothetical protein
MTRPLEEQFFAALPEKIRCSRARAGVRHSPVGVRARQEIKGRWNVSSANYGRGRNTKSNPSDACLNGTDPVSPPIFRAGTYRRETSVKNRSRRPFP